MALGIGPEHYGADVTRGLLTVRAFRLPRDFETVTSRRVGISAAQELPYRFYIKDNEHVSGR
jgi:3-methyladenine DNA glycosylase Mpg